MKYYFVGSLAELKSRIKLLSLAGWWDDRSNNGNHRFRCVSGANLHWSSGTRRVWFDGKPQERDELEQLCCRMLVADRPPPGDDDDDDDFELPEET